MLRLLNLLLWMAYPERPTRTLCPLCGEPLEHDAAGPCADCSRELGIGD